MQYPLACRAWQQDIERNILVRTPQCHKKTIGLPLNSISDFAGDTPKNVEIRKKKHLR
jgi:hypothetical protein